METSGDDSSSKQELTAHETGELGEVINEILNVLFNEASKKTSEHGLKISFSEKIKLDMAQRLMKMAEKYNGPTKFAKMIDSSNAAVPALTRIFGEQALISRLPPKAKDERIVALLDKAGATELSTLIRKAMGGPAPQKT